MGRGVGMIVTFGVLAQVVDHPRVCRRELACADQSLRDFQGFP